MRDPHLRAETSDLTCGAIRRVLENAVVIGHRRHEGQQLDLPGQSPPPLYQHVREE